MNTEHLKKLPVGTKILIDNTNGKSYNPDYELLECKLLVVSNLLTDCRCVYRHKLTGELTNTNSTFPNINILSAIQNELLQKTKNEIQW